MKANWFVAAAVMLSISVGIAAEKAFEAKCPISGAAAKEDKFVEYKGGKVYFCCGGCPEKFKADSAKFASKANHQLVATGQAKQEKCPLSGGACKEDKFTEVGGVKVLFCCDGCKGKVEKAEGDAKVDAVFADGPFAKAFKVAAAK